MNRVLGADTAAVAPRMPLRRRSPHSAGHTHPPWEGPFRFRESRICAGGLRGTGFTLPGIPPTELVHNARIARTITTGGPDPADVRELQPDGDKQAKYLYADRREKLRRRS